MQKALGGTRTPNPQIRSLMRWHLDNVAEWLRRQPAKLMGFARVGSNPTVVVLLLR